MRIIGITGGSGTGKTSVLHMLEKRGLYGIDADQVYHELLDHDEKLIGELKDRFMCIGRDEKIDRTLLRQIVFSDPRALELLNSITHDHVIKKLRRMLMEASARGAGAAAVDAAALFESGFDRECDYTIGVIAPRSLRLKRIIARDGLTEAEALKRINAQKDDEFYRRRCSFVVENDGDFPALEGMITQILGKIKI
jgi:dephospho-CoA kinase